MSGDGIGGIVAGCVVIAALPFVAAAVAVTAAAVGAIKLTESMVKHQAKCRERQKMELESASEELSGFYKKLETEMVKMDGKKSVLTRKAAIKIQNSAKHMQKKQKALEKQEEIHVLLRESRKEWKTIVKEEVQDKAKVIHKESKAKMEEEAEAFKKTKKAQEDLDIWSGTTKKEKEIQKKLASDEYKDAKATMKLLIKLANDQQYSDRDQELRTMKKQFENACKVCNMGLYESGYAICQDIVIKGTDLAVKLAMDFQEKHSLLGELEAKLEALIAELDTRRCMEVTDSETGRRYLEDLNDFGGDGFERLRSNLEKYLENVRLNGKKLTCSALEKTILKVEDEFAPMVDDLVETSLVSLEAHYKKLKVLGIIKNFMEEQGYKTSWVQPEGDDLRRRMVVNFSHEDTGNAVSFALDMDGNEEDLEHMVLDMMLFYDQHDVTEFEKKKLREHINEVLNQNGIKGSLDCSGQVGAASKRTEYNNREAVKAMITV